MEMIYLDNASTTFPKPDTVPKAVYDYMTQVGSNINRGGYESAYSVAETVFETRQLLSALFHGGDCKNVVFTKNVTESLNVILKGFLRPGDHILVSSMEHNAMMRPIRQLERLRCQVDLVYDAGTAPEAPAAVTDLLLGESVVIEKRTKRRELAEVDLRPMLFRLEAEPRPDRLVLLAEVAAQNPGMNPVLLAAAVERYLPEFAPDFVQVRRLAVLDGQGEVFC